MSYCLQKFDIPGAKLLMDIFGLQKRLKLHWFYNEFVVLVPFLLPDSNAMKSIPVVLKVA